ncbi:hypothetical protein NGDEOPKE_00004 [Enterococcus phage vB_OCPT_Carl]|uniref:Uncharacterized protein n=1 Tax=Enterococcus phage vB_OCPT_Car TaxID=2922319 RepID=A0A9E7J2J3_9CAUD|nr:hypothetical protein NGDEOPKE_00004 [Enterococcus phage vB_OCPT_Carl]UQT00177.1 hypothetical protein EGEOBHOM_00018 [Enterococcus phage vB_OCPT_Car]
MKFKRAIEELKEEEGITLEQEYNGVYTVNNSYFTLEVLHCSDYDEEYNNEELEDCHLHELVFRYREEQAYKSGYCELLKLLS